MWRQKRNGEKPSFTTLSRCENGSDLCLDLSCLPNYAKIPSSMQVRSAEGGCGTERCHTPISKQWIHSAASVNLSRRFWCVVNKSLIQAKVPDAADIPLISWKSLWTWLQLCHLISGKVKCFMAVPHQMEVMLTEQFQVQKLWAFFLHFTLHSTGNSKWVFQCSSNLDTLQWCVRLFSSLSYKVLFLDTNNFVKF